jgi:hypothetical protein
MVALSGTVVAGAYEVAQQHLRIGGGAGMYVIAFASLFLGLISGPQNMRFL